MILCSAYNEGDGAAGLDESLRDLPMLAKPYRKEQLADLERIARRSGPVSRLRIAASLAANQETLAESIV